MQGMYVSLTSEQASVRLLEMICDTSIITRSAMKNEETKQRVLGVLKQNFDYITSDYPELVSDIISRIVAYNTCKDPEIKITDFVLLVEWYNMSLRQHDKEWWNPQGQYYGLRMSEVINMFLIARCNFHLV